MAVQFRQHIELVGDNPLDARLTEKPYKAYLVARLAFSDEPAACVEHYDLSLGAIYAAMSFYEDNREAIEQASDQAWQDIRDVGIDGKEAIEKFKERMQDETT